MYDLRYTVLNFRWNYSILIPDSEVFVSHLPGLENVEKSSSLYQSRLTMLPLFSSFNLKGIPVKNRVIMPPMVCFGYAGEDGFVTRMQDWLPRKV